MVQKVLRDQRESQELLVRAARLDPLELQDQKEREVSQVYLDLRVKVTQVWKVHLVLQESQDLLALLANQADPVHLALPGRLEHLRQHPTWRPSCQRWAQPWME